MTQQDYTDAEKAIERIRLELVTRRFMVVVLAMITVWTGIAICMTGAPAFMETWFSPWSRYAIGGFAFGAGLLTSIAALFDDRGRKAWWCQVCGLTGVTGWYLWMAGAYVAILDQEGMHLVAPGHSLAVGASGRGYVPLIYIGLALLTATPLMTMVRLRFSRRT